jgi:hypothetical protein
MVLRLAGEIGQVSLARSADEASARASVDHHASEIRDALTSAARKITPPHSSPTRRGLDLPRGLADDGAVHGVVELVPAEDCFPPAPLRAVRPTVNRRRPPGCVDVIPFTCLPHSPMCLGAYMQPRRGS